MDRITKEQADEFTKELNALMIKYNFVFPCAIWVFRRDPKDFDLVANTELLVKEMVPDRYLYSFTLHNGTKEQQDGEST